MKTDNYILINGKPYLENASRADIDALKAKLPVKLTKAYTFNKRSGVRRVLQFTVVGTAYSAYGPRQYIDWNAYTETPVYFGFDQAAAVNKGSRVWEINASEVDFLQPHISRLFKLDSGGAE